MQLCWNQNPDARPSATQVHALINHLHITHTEPKGSKPDTISGTSNFEERWQRLKPNTIPKIDEHIAIIHAPSTSTQHFSSSDQEFDHSQTIQDSLSVDLDTAVSRSSSIMSDKEPLSVQIKSESLTNLHGSFEDVRNIYLTHNEMAILECHQGNISLDDSREKEQDKSDSSVDPWLKDIIAGSQDDVSYYKDVSDVIKNLDNILNSEKTSSSESSHQASPSRDNLSLDCKKDYPMQSSMVKSPGITNFQNILETGFNTKEDVNLKDVSDEDEGDRDTVGTLSHSFERHSDTTSQQTLENLTPETPIKDMDICGGESEHRIVDSVDKIKDDELPKVNIVYSDKKIPNLKELCVASMPSISGILSVSEECGTPCDNLERTEKETKSIDLIRNASLPHVNVNDENFKLEHVEHIVLPNKVNEIETSIKLESMTTTSLPPEVDNKLHPEFFDDLVEIKLKDSFSGSGDDNFVNNALVQSKKQESEASTLENDTVNDSFLIKDLEMETSTQIKYVDHEGISPNNIVKNKLLNTEIDPEIEIFNQNILQNNEAFGFSSGSEISKSPTKQSIQIITQTYAAGSLPFSLVKNQAHSANVSSGDLQNNEIKQDNHSLVVKNLETTTELSTDIKDLVKNRDVSSEIIIDSQKILQQEMDTQISSESPEILLLNATVLDVSIRNEVLELPLEDNTITTNKINDADSPGLALVKNKVASSDNTLPEITREIEINSAFKRETSIGINELITFIEFERNNFIDKPIIIESKDIPICNDSKELENPDVFDNTKDFTCLENTDIIKNESIEKIELPTENEDEITNNSVISKASSIECTVVIPSIDITCGSSPTHENIPLEKNNFYQVNSEISTIVNPPKLESNGLKFPNLSSYSNEDTILLSELDKSVVETQAPTEETLCIFKKLDEVPKHEISSELNQGDPEMLCSTDKSEDIKSMDDIFTLCAETDSKPLKQVTNLSSQDINTRDLNIETVIKKNVSQCTPETVQNNDNNLKIEEALEKSRLVMPPNIVQSIDKEYESQKEKKYIESTENKSHKIEEITKQNTSNVQANEQMNDSTIYMDLIENTDSEVLKNSHVFDKGKNEKEVNNSNVAYPEVLMFSNSIEKLEDTEYMDLPSDNKTVENLNKEQFDSSKNIDDNMLATSTPKTSDSSAENEDETIKNSSTEETLFKCETKAPDYGEGVTVTKLEQRFVPDSISPYESPTRSHHTDTYDENSSVVLGPFENCTIELFKGVKSHEFTDIPREELLAFSSNFSEMNLETPSPLRDGNFLNEVPDLLHDDVQFDDITSISEIKPVSTHDLDIIGTTGTQSSENSEESQSETQKHISPSTPPNSPGVFLASSSQEKYLVDIDLNLHDSVPESSSSLQQELELNQIELQITSKLAMAENENNLNIEYSGPLTVEGLVEEGSSEEVPETYLAGNGSSVEDLRNGIGQLDEECVKALRNELELKLPLAQVSFLF